MLVVDAGFGVGIVANACADVFVQNGIGEQTTLFPMNTRLKGLVRQRFDDSIYHGAKVELDDESLDKRLVLRVGKSKLPTSVWSAGQREFTPLLLGVYCLTGPPQNVLRSQYYQYVVIEEPEMGLHPSAIQDTCYPYCRYPAGSYTAVLVYGW